MNEDLNGSSAAARNKDTIWTPGFISLFIMNAALHFGQFMISALIPMYTEHLGASAAIVGVVSSAFAITALAIRPVVGPSTQYYRNNRLLAAAIGILLTAFVCYGLAGSVSLIIAGRLLHGIGMGFLAPVILALACDALPSRRLASGISIFSLGQAVAMAVGPTVGLELVQYFGYRPAFIMGSALMGIVLVFSLLLRAEPPVREGRIRLSFRDIVAPEVVFPAAMMFFLAGTNACIQAFILIYGGAAGVDDIGLFFTSHAVCLLFVRPIVGKIAEKYGMDKVMFPGLIMFALSLVVISFSRTLPMFVLSGAFSAFGYGICQPAVQTLCIQLATKARRGVASNTNYIGVDAGYLITPIIAGFIVTLVQEQSGDVVAGYAEMFRIMTIPIFVAFLIYLMKRKELAAKIKEKDSTQ